MVDVLACDAFSRASCWVDLQWWQYALPVPSNQLMQGSGSFRQSLKLR